MTVWNGAALFGAIFFLALTPTLSSITVAARSASFGRVHGIAAALGVASGDVAYVLVAIMGLAAVASEAEGLLDLLKFAGAAYLTFLGFQLWQAAPSHHARNADTRDSLLASFLAGFLLTLSDYKAVLFYLVFLPAFVDLEAISTIAAAAVVMIVAVAVTLAKLIYAVVADKVGARVTPVYQTAIQRFAALVLVGIAIMLLLRT